MGGGWREEGVVGSRKVTGGGREEGLISWFYASRLSWYNHRHFLLLTPIRSYSSHFFVSWPVFVDLRPAPASFISSFVLQLLPFSLPFI